MPDVVTYKTELNEFGIGLIAGLKHRGITRLSRRRMLDVHSAFIEAFNVVETGLGQENLNFTMWKRDSDGSSPQVDDIIEFWLSTSYVQLDTRHNQYVFVMKTTEANYFYEHLPGGILLYEEAIDAFLEYLNPPTH